MCDTPNAFLCNAVGISVHTYSASHLGYKIWCKRNHQSDVALKKVRRWPTALLKFAPGGNAYVCIYLLQCHDRRSHVSGPAVVTLGADLSDATVPHDDALQYRGIRCDAYTSSYQYGMFSLEYVC